MIQLTFPERLLGKADLYFQENYQLKQDFQKSKIHFNNKIDEELVHYMNITRSLLNSTSELIAKLPTESKPNGIIDFSLSPARSPLADRIRVVKSYTSYHHANFIILIKP